MKNQKRGRATGAQAQRREEPKPRLAHVVAADLTEPNRTAELFQQAMDRGLVQDSAMDRLQFFAAAQRARRLAHNPGAFFATILRRRLWRNIAACDEDSARQELARIPEFFYGANLPPAHEHRRTPARPRSPVIPIVTTDAATIRELVRHSLASAALTLPDDSLTHLPPPTSC